MNPSANQNNRWINYRYPSEMIALGISVVIMLLGVFFFTTITFGALLILIAISSVYTYIFLHMNLENDKRSAVQIGANQLPELQAIINECRQYIDIPPDTRFFLSYNYEINANARGLVQPYIITLYSALVDGLDRDELKFIIAHEMGHVKFGHTALISLINQVNAQVGGIPFVGAIISLSFLFWSRTAEFTADRAGLMACGSLDKAQSALIKLMAGPRMGGKVNRLSLAMQARATRGLVGDLMSEFLSVGATHPMMTTRIRKLVEFANSPTFKQLRPDANLAFEGTEHWLAK